MPPSRGFSVDCGRRWRLRHPTLYFKNLSNLFAIAPSTAPGFRGAVRFSPSSRRVRVLAWDGIFGATKRGKPGSVLRASGALASTIDTYPTATPFPSNAFIRATTASSALFVLDEGEEDLVWTEDRMMAQSEGVVIGLGSASPGQKEADMDLAIVRKVLTGAASAVAAVLLVSAATPGQLTPSANSQKMAVLHATVTITGGLAFTGSYDDRLSVRTCADVARSGTGETGGTGGLTGDRRRNR